MDNQQETKKTLSEEQIYCHNQNMAVLKEIQSRLPQELIDNLTTEIMNTDQEESVRNLLLDENLDTAVRKKLSKDLKKGKFRFIEEVVNEEVTKKIEKYYEDEIKAAIADSRLTPPDDDPYYEMMCKKANK